MSEITYIDQTSITNKRILVRVDYNVSLKKDGSINDDTKIKQSLSTLQLLLQGNNKLILMSHLGKPAGQKVRDEAFSLKPVATRLQTYLSGYTVKLVNDFLTEKEPFARQSEKEILILENTRFYEGEKKNDPVFSKQLADLADVYVDDAFGSVHRAHASTVGVAAFLPSFGGLLLKDEVVAINQVLKAPQRPVVAIIGGAKIATKIGIIEKFMMLADDILIGGAMTNNFLKAKGMEIGKGLVDPDFVPAAKKLLDIASAQNKHIILPVDRRIGQQQDEISPPIIKKVEDVDAMDETLDIGPETEKIFADVISKAKTILWNGPVGYFENPQFNKGNIAVYNAIINNPSADSILGGGDTLSVIKKLPDNNKITHISTGGGAMLELIEKGTLPGLEALKKTI